MFLATGNNNSGGTKRERAEDGGGEDDKQQKKSRRANQRKKQKEQAAAWRATQVASAGGAAPPVPSAPQGQGTQRKGTGKGRPNLPLELVGLTLTVQEGEHRNEPICYGFNMAGCDKAEPGKRCQKGWHICAKCNKKEHGARGH